MTNREDQRTNGLEPGTGLKLLRFALGLYAAAQIVLLAFVFANHVRFPLFLDLMEGTVLQHAQRAAAFDWIYPRPSPDYVPFAYNPLYYVLSVPFSRVLGMSLPTLRLLSFAGTMVCAIVLFSVVRGRTGSKWWGLICCGLFAAAYRVMSSYLDTAHSDSWMLATALLGTWLLDRSRSRGWDIAGVVVLMCSFWFKQHGAIFALGGLSFLMLRDGIVRSLPAWATALVLGPTLYVFAGPMILGPEFHYFTWEVPHRWTTLNLRTFYVYAGFVAISYPLLALFSGYSFLQCFPAIAARMNRSSPSVDSRAAAGDASASTGDAKLRRSSLDVWHVQMCAACLTGFMGALDPGCAFNVFIPMGAWFILCGTLGIARLWDRLPVGRGSGTRTALSALALIGSFALLAYDPRSVLVPGNAAQSYRDLQAFLSGLNGSVYAPWLGQLPDGYRLHPAAHWVALEDMVRGPGRNTRDQPVVITLILGASSASGSFYVLANRPLKELSHFLGFMSDHCVLELDLGDRFKPLGVMPGRYPHGWPRYLYRYKTVATASGQSPPAMIN